MLLDHPNAKAIFEAAELVELFQSSLEAMARAISTERSALRDKCYAVTAAMHVLNNSHFEASKSIFETVTRLEMLLEQAYLMKNDVTEGLGEQFWSETLFPLILKIESVNEGFGSCMV